MLSSSNGTILCSEEDGTGDCICDVSLGVGSEALPGFESVVCFTYISGTMDFLYIICAILSHGCTVNGIVVLL